jgi:hypothetical protein
MTNFLNDYEREKAKIQADSRLSGKGKEEKIQQLRDTYISKAKTAKKQLRKTAVISALSLRDAQAKQAKHLRQQRSELDFSRLKYEMEVVKAKIADAESLSDVYIAWNEAKESGDDYIIRVWKETASKSMERFKETKGVSGLKSRIIQDMAEISLKKPDAEIEEQEDKYFRALREVEADAQALDNVLSDGRHIKRPVVERAVFNGIKFNKGEISTDFDYQEHPLSERQETASEVAGRLEREEQHKAERTAVLAEKLGVKMDNLSL